MIPLKKSYLSPMETELFEIKLNDQGKMLLLRIYSWAKVLYICSFITFVFDLVNTYLGLRAYRRFSGSYPTLAKLQSLAGLGFLPVYGTLLIIQAWLFYRFSQRSKDACAMGNSGVFNDAFNWLLKHIIIASILFALNS